MSMKFCKEEKVCASSHVTFFPRQTWTGLSLFSSTSILCLFGGCQWWLSSLARAHSCGPSKPCRLSLSVPVPAKRPQKPKRSKNQARRNATVSSSSTATPLGEKNIASPSVFINFLKVLHSHHTQSCYWDACKREFVSLSQLCDCLQQFIAVSLHSVMSVIILFSFIASLTQLFI